MKDQGLASPMRWVAALILDLTLQGPTIELMNKALILLEEYNELVFLEALLKKLGFDTLGLQKTVLLERKLLGFSPQLVITQVRGRRWSGAKILRPLRENARKLNPQCKIVGLSRGGDSLSAEDQEFYDGFAQSPIAPQSFLEVIAKVLGREEGPLLAKYAALSNYRSQEESSPARRSRSQTYAEMVEKSAPLKGKTVSMEEVERRAKASAPGGEEARQKVKAVHAEKKAYLRALMKSKPDS